MDSSYGEYFLQTNCSPISWARTSTVRPRPPCPSSFTSLKSFCLINEMMSFFTISPTFCFSQPNAADDHPQHCRGRARPRQQVILKFLDKSTSGGLASVEGAIQCHVVRIR